MKLEKERKLLAKLDDIKFELEPLEKAKQELDAKAEQRANIFVWGGLAYMAFQFGFLARLTWWEYSWDIMEPVTYFVGYGTAIVFYAYFVITRQVLNFYIIIYFAPPPKGLKRLIDLDEKIFSHEYRHLEVSASRENCF